MATTVPNRSPLIVSPHLYLADVTGRPLDYGRVYFGEPNKDGEFYPINIFSDKELTEPLAQPVYTKGGFLHNNGDITEVFAYEGVYSVKVLDQYGRKIFYKGEVAKQTIEDVTSDVVDAAQVEINRRMFLLDAAIAAAAAAGAGENGWAALLVQTDDGLTQQAFNDKSVTTVESIADLLKLTNLKNRQTVITKSYWAGLNKGGLTFIYDKNMPRSKHNGGTIIDPTKTWDGSRNTWASVDSYLPDIGVGVWGVDDVSKVGGAVQQAITRKGGSLSLGAENNPTNFRTNRIKLGGFLGKSASTGYGCWVAQPSELSFTMFGAVGDASFEVDGTDDSYAMLATIEALPKKNGVLNLESLFYTHGNADLRNIVLWFNGFKDLTIKGNLATIQSHSNNLPTVSNAIMRFDFCDTVIMSALKFDGRLDTRLAVGGDANTNNEQHNLHIGYGCKNIGVIACTSNRALMDGFYIYGGKEGTSEATSNIYFNDCKALYNYRQGLSQITAFDVKINGGEYSYTGRCKDKVSGTEKGISPKRGIDIEANDVVFENRSTYQISNVRLEQNANAGFSASNNSYGSIKDSTVINNPYYGILIEFNAKNSTVDNCTFSGNGNTDIFAECTHNIKLLNNKFYSEAVMINCVGHTGSVDKDIDVTVSGNIFAPPVGKTLAGGFNFDYSKVKVFDNKFVNTKSISVGGNGDFDFYDNNVYSDNTLSVITPTWAGVMFGKITNNKVNVTSGGLFKEGTPLGQIRFASRNMVSTDPNSGKYEIVDGKLIWTQAEAVAEFNATTIAELNQQINNLRGALRNQGLLP